MLAGIAGLIGGENEKEKYYFADGFKREDFALEETRSPSVV